MEVFINLNQAYNLIDGLKNKCLAFAETELFFLTSLIGLNPILGYTLCVGIHINGFAIESSLQWHIIYKFLSSYENSFLFSLQTYT